MAAKAQSRYVHQVTEETLEDTQETERPKRRRWPVWLGAVALLLLISLLIAWTQREPLARNYIDSELSARGVEASYDITEFGFNRQRIENLVLGDPDNPDLTAEWAELRVRIGFGIPSVESITAHGVRLDGELIDGQVRFGQLDNLLPEPTGEPFVFPELDITLSDALVRLDTPYGPVAVALAGSGPLHDGFAGYASARSPALAIAGCTVRALRADVAVAVDGRRPAIDGPLRAEELKCDGSGLAVVEPRIALNAIFSEAFDRWGGDADFRAASLRQDAITAGATHGRIEFDGAAGQRTRGSVALESETLRMPEAATRQASLLGHYRFIEESGYLSLDGDVRLGDARVAEAQLASLGNTLRSAEGTPVGPVGAAFASAMERAATRFDANFRLTMALRNGGGAIRLANLNGRSESGARLEFVDGEGAQFIWPNRTPSFDGTIRLAGGGFPQMLVELEEQQGSRTMQGYARIAPFDVDGARMALAPVNFSSAPGGITRINTVMELTGPLAGGRVERLRVPIAGVIGQGGTLTVGQGCVPLSWSRMQVASLDIGPTELPLCPVEGGSLLRYVPGSGMSGGAAIAGPRLRARLGGTPLLVTARDFRLPLRNPTFEANAVAVRLGPAGQQSELDIANLRAAFVSGGVDGRYSGASGMLNAVPIRLGESEGAWRFVNGVLNVEGDADITYADADPLFEPLRTRNLDLHLENNRITMTASVREPDSDIVIGEVDLAHSLNTGIGEAVLESDDIVFNDRLQPSDLTHLVLGIIADVQGLVSGTGTIRWDADGNVTSDGVYQMADVDLAAPFGPVEGLSGEIRFDDLLGMNTAPGQVATIREINPGVIATDGIVRYQLLDSNRVQVEGARFPFAGGEIILEPTILDFREDRDRRMVFRVEGVDAFRFLEARGFENIIATGLFDGELPMVFNQDGGRIENGVLTSRTGGTFSYTGEVTDVEMGVFSTMAFNALELIRYSEMQIGFDGALDGEMVTNVSFTGVSPNLANMDGIAGLLTRQVADIPLQFNITLNAPFNQMLYSMRLLDDPGFLVNQAIQARVRATRAEQGVQDAESDDLP